MSEVTKPIALDESLNTTESTPRNIADVVADETGDLVTQATAIVTKLQALINAVKPNASDIPLDPITGMSANNVQLGISELKGTLDYKVNVVKLTTPISCTYADSSTIGFRCLVAERVDITSLTGYPTGKTIIGMIPVTVEALHLTICGIYQGQYLNINAKESGTYDVNIYVIYKD